MSHGHVQVHMHVHMHMHMHMHMHTTRNDAFKELSAMAVEYGTPQFFLTFTGYTPAMFL